MKEVYSQYPWLPNMEHEKSELPLLSLIKKLRYPSNAHTKIQKALGIGGASTHTRRRTVKMPPPSVSNSKGLCKEAFVDEYYDNLPPDTRNADKKTWDEVAAEWDALLLYKLGLIDSDGKVVAELVKELEATPAYQAKMKKLEPAPVVHRDYDRVQPAHRSTAPGVNKRQEQLVHARNCYTQSHLVPDRGYDNYVQDFLKHTIDYLEDQVEYLKINVQEASVSDNFVNALRDALQMKKDKLLMDKEEEELQRSQFD